MINEGPIGPDNLIGKEGQATLERQVKTLTEWPLSKVELVEVNGQMRVRKTVHADFASEFPRQQYLRANLKSTKVPEIFETREIDGAVACLMEYVDIARKVTDTEAMELLYDFQGESRGLRDASFPVYNKEAFEANLVTAQSYGGKLNAEDFVEFFDTEPTILHGDFGPDQLAMDRENNLYLLDFGKSFIGPGVLDFAYFARSHEACQKQLSTPFKSDYFQRALEVVAVRQIAWFDLCLRRYIKDHDYRNKEIKAELELLTSYSQPC